mgnify:CR=1 FL=1
MIGIIFLVLLVDVSHQRGPEGEDVSHPEMKNAAFLFLQSIIQFELSTFTLS